MLTMEHCKKPMLVAMSVDGVKIVMITMVRKFLDAFPDDLPRLPPDQEIKFGIDILPSTAPISKNLYRMTL